MKINNQIFLSTQKALFLANFSNFGGKKKFLKKYISANNNLIRVSSTVSKLRET